MILTQFAEKLVIIAKQFFVIDSCSMCDLNISSVNFSAATQSASFCSVTAGCVKKNIFALGGMRGISMPDSKNSRPREKVPAYIGLISGRRDDTLLTLW